MQDHEATHPPFKVVSENSVGSGQPALDERCVSLGLTTRELEVLRLIATGLTNVEISEALAISRHTVKSHVIHISNKLGASDRTEAVVLAARLGMI